MIYFLTLLAYGDNLITLSLLAKLQRKAGIRIIGTGVTTEIAEFITELDIPIIVKSERIPAFYDIKKNGVSSAIKELTTFRRKISGFIEKEDVLIFEKNDIRNVLIAKSIAERIYGPEKNLTVYEDRRNLLSRLMKEIILLKEARMLCVMPKRVTINPTSRIKQKGISLSALAYLISYLKTLHVEVVLLDYDREYFNLRNIVDDYQAKITLDKSLKYLVECDLYIGADSLFVHFAYYYDIPFLVLFNKINLYYMPPSTEKQKNYVDGVSRLSEKQFCLSLDTFFEKL